MHKGVNFSKLPGRRRKPWFAGITVHGKWQSLGHFATEDEAAEAYRQAKKKRLRPSQVSAVREAAKRARKSQ